MRKKIKRYNSIGIEELKEVKKVMKSGILSDFLASSGNKFLGGKKVQEFEKSICKFFKVRHAITTNSWTSGLISAIGAMGIEPGDEVICSPWTMSASAISIIHWNAIPIFVDINPKTFGLDLNQVKKVINKKTKAIMSVDIFGQSDDIIELKKIIGNRKIKIISDTAQAPGSYVGKKFSGTLADIGGYSLNYHKHINTGEGGIIVTNDASLAKKARLIRNHAESTISKKASKKDLINMVGYNFRLGEIESAIGIQQLKKLKKIIRYRQKLAKILINGLKNLKGLQTPIIKNNFSHVFYNFPLILQNGLEDKRSLIVKTLKKKGIVGISEGYVNLHKLPMFQNKIAYGSKGYPWSTFNPKIDYKKLKLTNAEYLHEKSFFSILLCSYDFKLHDMHNYVKAFKEVWKNLDK